MTDYGTRHRGTISVQGIIQNISVESNLDGAIDGAFWVHETVQEDLRIKEELLSLLDGKCKPDVVLATNTSSFLLTDLCRGLRRRERVLGIHFITPAHVFQAVELIYADSHRSRWSSGAGSPSDDRPRWRRL
jgi:3-hydroxybutyryl-CoA dehydrogenase